MATSTDSTSFRVISEDGELLSRESDAQTYHTLESFTEYAKAECDQPGEIAQWYVPRTDELLASQSEQSGLVTTPTADLFD